MYTRKIFFKLVVVNMKTNYRLYIMYTRIFFMKLLVMYGLGE